MNSTDYPIFTIDICRLEGVYSNHKLDKILIQLHFIINACNFWFRMFISVKMKLKWVGFYWCLHFKCLFVQDNILFFFLLFNIFYDILQLSEKVERLTEEQQQKMANPNQSITHTKVNWKREFVCEISFNWKY